MMTSKQQLPRRSIWGGWCALVVVLLACAAPPVPSDGTTARWACPSPTPLPYGEDGPVKREYDCNCVVDPTTGAETCDRCEEYFAKREQEFGDQFDGPPFPEPTPYGFTSTSFMFGQRVEVAPFHVTVSATTSTDLSATESLYLITLTWHSRLAEEVPILYEEQIHLRAITQPNGMQRTDDGWGVTAAALTAADIPDLPMVIPPDESTVIVPVIAPRGTPTTVEVRFYQGGSPDPAAEVQRDDTQWHVVQWQDSALDPSGAPPCTDPGALTDWDSGDGVPITVDAPEERQRVVQLLYQQLGKPYVWGAEGPETFDCSGLMQWVWGQVDVRIPRTTDTQWAGLPPQTPADLLPGDLVLFDMTGVGAPSHVGAVVLEDMQWKMIHASTPELGVRIEERLFDSPFWSQYLMGLRTV